MGARFSLDERLVLSKEPLKLRSFTTVGGYPVVYYASDGEAYCAKCAADQYLKEQDPEEYIGDDRLVAAEVYWEGPEEHCCECGTLLESAYGDPDSDNEEE